MSDLIMAIDPGETTGWAFGRASKGKFTLQAHGEINAAELLGSAVAVEVAIHQGET